MRMGRTRNSIVRIPASPLAVLARVLACTTFGFLGQALVLGRDRAPILPQAEATPARSPSPAPIDSVEAGWRRLAPRLRASDSCEAHAIASRVHAIATRRTVSRDAVSSTITVERRER
jgi:hypothetical protein